MAARHVRSPVARARLLRPARERRRTPGRRARPAEKTLAQFALTRAACETVGWQYEVWTGLPEAEAASLRWLAGYRQDRAAPTAEVADRLSVAVAQPQALRAGVEQVATFTRQPIERIILPPGTLLDQRDLADRFKAGES